MEENNMKNSALVVIGLHQIHLLQHGKKRLHRSCAVRLHRQLR